MTLDAFSKLTSPALEPQHSHAPNYPNQGTHCTGPKGVLSDYTLQNASPSSVTLHTHSAPIYESYRPHTLHTFKVHEIDFNTFVPAIDDQDPFVTVIVHVFEPTHNLCIQTNHYLETLAEQYPLVRFLKIQVTALESVMYFDPVALPALLVYRDKSLIKCLLRMVDEMPNWKLQQEYTVKDLESYLVDQCVLDDREATQEIEKWMHDESEEDD